MSRRLQAAQERRNAASKEIGKAMAAKDAALADRLKAEITELKSFVQNGEAEERRLDQALNDALAVIPNVPLDDVPVGADENDNVEVRKVGEVRPRPNWVREHFEIGEALGQMDFERAAKLSGARFTVLKGQLARLERALGQFMLDLHTTEHGYTEVQPPLLVTADVMYGTGQLPKFEDDLFATSRSPSDADDFDCYCLWSEKGLFRSWTAVAEGSLPLGDAGTEIRFKYQTGGRSFTMSCAIS